jgi:hypothetical protein
MDPNGYLIGENYDNPMDLGYATFRQTQGV